MRELRIGAICFADGLEAWQAQVIARVRALDRVDVTLLSLPRDAATDFATRRSRARTLSPHGLAQAWRPGAANDFDLLLNLTAADAESGASEGALSLDVDDPRAPGRREARGGAPVTAVRVRRDRDGSQIVAQAILKTASSERRNGDRILNECAILFERAVRAIRDGVQVSVTAAPAPVLPSSVARLRRRVQRTIEKLFYRTRWTLGIVNAPLQQIIDDGRIDDFRPLRGLPPNRFFADPFPLRVHGLGLTILAENASLTPPHKGHLSLIDVSRRGAVAQVRNALRTPEHLSFPFLLREGGETICLPECHEAGALRAFKVGDAWVELPRVLEGVAAVDPVLLRHDGRWWLFCCDRAHEDTTHLFVFIADDDWSGPWRPHPLNPVKSDVRSSRPAGAIILHEGALYRPAQDCSERYGGALSLQRITALSETAFAEVEAFRIEPQDLGRRYLGVHTLNGMADLAVVDVLERRLVFT